MGQKIHPYGLRLGITKKWISDWFSEKKAPEYVKEDYEIRRLVKERYRGAGIAKVSIERPTEQSVSLVIYAARPGIIIGKGGQEIDSFQAELESRLKRKVKISIKEIDSPDLEAVLVSEDIAARLMNRIPAARAMKEVMQRVMTHGARGVKIRCSGRIGGAEIARSMEVKAGRVPLQTIRADIDYGQAEALTKYGLIGIKVWLYRGDIYRKRGGEVRGAVSSQAAKV
ncbi:MAG: 30S ribosomal protein S3 [Candidatus Bipolaricaulota bacterium]|nr:30S ribosomal protein S3 [Candidatus Bipolaricaulota bacterium]MCS7275068.1 30S ribosomal protein S3 [Candidatus Bipolaricaulota bacterium]MDW8110396.1 30S ribosomal protein S3 [Candidatus Bipolaricaulota bacterium]MDW8329533.1 30S ribosomal protein S3 [Candidatus Bipolaricaulota bacterium]